MEVKEWKAGDHVWQGDVGFVKIRPEDLPKNLKPKDNTVAYGEATGHCHTFGNNAKVMIANDGTQYAILEGQETVTHQEHDNITFPKSVIKVIRQREVDLVEGVRNVMD